MKKSYVVWIKRRRESVFIFSSLLILTSIVQNHFFPAAITLWAERSSRHLKRQPSADRHTRQQDDRRRIIMEQRRGSARLCALKWEKLSAEITTHWCRIHVSLRGHQSPREKRRWRRETLDVGNTRTSLWTFADDTIIYMSHLAYNFKDRVI